MCLSKSVSRPPTLITHNFHFFFFAEARSLADKSQVKYGRFSPQKFAFLEEADAAILKANAVTTEAMLVTALRSSVRESAVSIVRSRLAYLASEPAVEPKVNDALLSFAKALLD